MRKFTFAIFLLFACMAARAQVTQSAAFTYQGQLRQAGAPVDGARDLEFALFDSAGGGSQIGATVDAPSWPIVGGLFTIDLSFPGAFSGPQRWLEVRIDGTPMLPRQPITPVPFAQFGLSGTTGPAGPEGPAGEPGFPGSVPAAGCAPGDALRSITEGGFLFSCHTVGLHDWTRPSADVSVPGGAVRTQIVRCPDGAIVISGGVESLERSSFGTPRQTTLRISESFPTFDGGRWGWQVALYNTGGVVMPLRAFAVCAGN